MTSQRRPNSTPTKMDSAKALSIMGFTSTRYEMTLGIGDEQMDRSNSQTSMECCFTFSANFFFLGGGCHKQNTLPLGQIQPSSPSTEELDALGLEVVLSSLLLSLWCILLYFYVVQINLVHICPNGNSFRAPNWTPFWSRRTSLSFKISTVLMLH